jgi:hypothetical protein
MSKKLGNRPAEFTDMAWNSHAIRPARRFWETVYRNSNSLGPVEKLQQIAYSRFLFITANIFDKGLAP